MNADLALPFTPAPVDLAAEWAAVAAAASDHGASGSAAAPPGAAADPPGDHTPADLGSAMRDFAARRDLRRILIAFGAIGKPREGGQSGNQARPEDVVGAFITAPRDVLRSMLASAGAIQDPDRIDRFIAGIHAAGGRCTPSDPAAVEQWIGEVAAILRDQG